MSPGSRRARPETIGAVQSGLRAIILGTERYRRVLAGQVGVSVTELVVLGHVFTYGPMTPREIAEWLGFSTGATTGVLDRAERAGLLVRKANPADRRSVLVSLTKGGKRTLDWMYERTNAYLGDALADSSDEELALLVSVMRRVGESLQVAAPVLPTNRRAKARSTN